jgi:hypothetical protein
VDGDAKRFTVRKDEKLTCFGAYTYETRRGRESNPRIAVLQTATLPLGYPANLRERTISLSQRLYQALNVDR